MVEHGQQGHGHCLSLRDQHNLQQDREIPHLSCCCCCYFWDGSFTPQIELGLVLGFFCFLLQLSTSSLPFPPSPGVQAFKQQPPSPSHHECHRFEMLPDATGASAQREKWPFKGKLPHLLGRVLLQAASEVSHNYFMKISL